MLFRSFWLGATQTLGGEWSWIAGPETGLAFWQGEASGTVLNAAFNNWDLGASLPQPNSANENYLDINVNINGYGLNFGYWDDANSSDQNGYIIEFGSVVSVPEPKFLFIFGGSVFVLGLMGHRKMSHFVK